MRIDDRNLTGNPASQTGKADQAQEVARQAESKPQQARAAAGGDRVELSGLTGGLARALEADASQRQVRVEKLADDYTAGRYQVDSMAVSKAMVAEMRASVS